MRFNPILCNIPVTRNTAKRTLRRMHDEAQLQGHDRPDLSMHYLKAVGKVEVTPGHAFVFRALTGRCRFIIESGGQIDPAMIPVEVRGPVLDETREMERVTPPTPDEIEAVLVARAKKLLLTAAA